MGKYLKLFETHAEYESFIQTDYDKPNVSYCEQENEVHYNPLPVIIATDDTNLPLMNIARTYGWIKQDATEFYESEANNVTDITRGIVNTFVNTHTQETLDTPYGTYTLDLWHDKDENKWYDTTELFGGDFSLTNISFKRIRPIKSQDGETASLYERIYWGNVEHFNEFKYFTNVTSISDNAFYEYTSLTSITIPNSVTSIGKDAFRGCGGLTGVTIPNSVTSIGVTAFYDCSGLTSVTIGDNVTSMGNDAFGGCTNLPITDNIRYADTYVVEAIDKTLTEYTIKSDTKWIGAGAFEDCDNLTNITIPDSVIGIGYWAFAFCKSLTSIIIPDSITSIGNDVFYKCFGLTSVTIGNGVTSIGDEAFYDCTNLTNITSLVTTAPTIQSQTFYNVKTNGTLTVPSGSSGYDVWMGTGDYYLGKYNWTKVEQ